MKMKKTATVDDYISAQPQPVQRVVKQLRGIIRKALPGADEVISYQMPAYKLHGRIVLYYAAWKEHYSLYPANTELVARFEKALAPYETSGRGTIRFPLAEPVPATLIASIAKFRAQQVAARAATRQAARRASRTSTSAKRARKKSPSRRGRK